ncbi:MAG: family 16 glycosylhydrolase [Clostridia bacterium]|nr:family 16 glycosylhydrolase [Clostridia bacterium]
MKVVKIGLVKKSLFVLLATLIAVTFCGCSLFGSQIKPAVYISQSEITLQVGETVKLSAVTTDENSVTWVSGSDEIATVDAEGLVTGVSVGETLLTVASSSAMASCTIKVVEKSSVGGDGSGGTGTPADPEIFTLYLDSIKMKTGETITLKAVSSLGDDIEWESSRPEVAKVDGGRVTALRAGTTEITAKTEKVSAKCSVTVTQAVIEGADKDGYALIWNDEFEGTSLDTSKWDYQIGIKDNYHGKEYGENYWGNWELQYYTQNAVSVADGSLKITATKQNMGDRSYTSGRILTRDKASWTYGYFEAKIKTPTGDGMWPAFWMLPQPSSFDNITNEYGGWAANGEIDIMEAKGRLNNKVDTTIHFGGAWPDNQYLTHETTLSSNTDQWHTYAVDWTEDYIAWYVDGRQVYKLLNNQWYSTASQSAAAPFDKPFYILLNLAVGGTYDPSAQIDPNFTSAAMYVDYVRVYEKIA